MSSAEPLDVLIVSLGTTHGLRAADEQLRASIARAGATVELVRARRMRRVRTLAATDAVQALAARRAAQARLARGPVRAVIYSTTTAALLWPRPGAIRFDAPAAGNRPGRHGVWQRPAERRRLTQAPLLVPWSEGGLAEAALGADREQAAVVVPVAVDPSGPLQGERDLAAVSYVANPHKKGLDRVLAAWAAARRPGEELVLAGASPDLVRASPDLASASSDLTRADLGGPHPGPDRVEGVRVAGPLPAGEFRALLRRARVFVCAPRREDYGLAQLEALADGCRLVTTPAPGPYAALPIARELDPRLVREDLAGALRTALDEPLEASGAYAARARELLAPWGSEAVDRRVAGELLARLLEG